MAKLIVLDEVNAFIEDLERDTPDKIYASLEFLAAGKIDSILVKPIKGKIKELSVRQYRIIFCQIGDVIYVIAGFKKQSKKTPHRIIERAEQMYNKIVALQN